ncbi:hypothetical protein [Paenibacillus sp. N3.4]|uniref:hypothetical protein n=1 Tax=Paenibacillus sp. N3.4 TaxID=2603222 RepID=UPI0011C87B77|nr:hypothetical protein [Paenibacillus sp. N3.4]TXK81906.1 hypothetical protein FU659_15330 [Paenibacillus sp. N3.4]
MDSNFIQMKFHEGDLKMSHKKKDYGLTVTTKELILHKPHINYYLKLEHIITIIPYKNKGVNTITFINKRSENQELTQLSLGTEHFRIYVQAATVHNRSGLFELGPTDVIIPIHPSMLRAISESIQPNGLTIF